MHENDLLLIEQDEVWFARQISRTAPISDLHSPNNAANNHFWACSTGADVPHDLAALDGIKYIHIVVD